MEGTQQQPDVQVSMRLHRLDFCSTISIITISKISSINQHGQQIQHQPHPITIIILIIILILILITITIIIITIISIRIIITIRSIALAWLVPFSLVIH